MRRYIRANAQSFAYRPPDTAQPNRASTFTNSSSFHRKKARWSMRSWESEPSPTFSSGRADSQDRMDQMLILASLR